MLQLITTIHQYSPFLIVAWMLLAYLWRRWFDAAWDYFQDTMSPQFAVQGFIVIGVRQQKYGAMYSMKFG